MRRGARPQAARRGCGADRGRFGGGRGRYRAPPCGGGAGRAAGRHLHRQRARPHRSARLRSHSCRRRQGHIARCRGGVAGARSGCRGRAVISFLGRFDVRAQIALFALLAVYFMVWPVWRAGFPIEIAQNEGWNAYHADAAMGATNGAAALYPPSDTLIVNNYPPLSFYVVGTIAKVTGVDALYVGRVMSLVAVVVLGGLIAKVIGELGG